MQRNLTIPALLGLSAVLALGHDAHAFGGRGRGGQTYHYNGSQGYYTPAPAQAPAAPASSCGCVGYAPHTHAAPAAPASYYAPQPTYAAPQTGYTPGVLAPRR